MSRWSAGWRAPQQRRADRYNGLMRADGFCVCAAAAAFFVCAAAAAR